ncbi:MAG: hypothetical protein U1E65_06790 [Myxococcota bacterium]
MSDDKKKKLMPEILPAPTQAEQRTPVARVEERAQRMLQRFKAVGASASAAVLTAHCTGYAVVDPLPPPPTQCSEAPVDALNNLNAHASYDRTVTVPRPPVVFRLVDDNYSLSEARHSGVTLIEASVQGGTITSSSASAPPAASELTLHIAPDSDTALLVVTATVGCGSARITKGYLIPYHLPTSETDEPVVGGP